MKKCMWKLILSPFYKIESTLRWAIYDTWSLPTITILFITSRVAWGKCGFYKERWLQREFPHEAGKVMLERTELYVIWHDY
jgi:hypothetical protein